MNTIYDKKKKKMYKLNYFIPTCFAYIQLKTLCNRKLSITYGSN